MDRIQKEYLNIVKTDLDKSILSAYEGHFSKVSWAGRFVRMIKNLWSSGDSFADCRSTHVAQAIVDFAYQNQSTLQKDQIENLFQKVVRLNDKYKAKHKSESFQLQSSLTMLQAILENNPDFAYLIREQMLEKFPQPKFHDWTPAPPVTLSNIHALTLQQGNVTLVLAESPIQVHTLNSGQIGAVVNAANSTMYYGGGGTNRGLSDVSDEDAWNKNAADYLNQNGKKRLDVTECAAVPFPAPAPGKVKAGQIDAKYLFHVLGPELSEPPQLEQAQQEVYQAYKIAFGECRRLGLTSVQLPLISTGIFASVLDEKNLKKWKEMVDAALFRALKEESQNANDPEVTVVLVGWSPENPGHLPWEKYLQQKEEIEKM